MMGTRVVRSYRRVLAAGHSNDHIAAADKHEVRMENVKCLAGADDDPHRNERFLAEAGLDVVGTEHVAIDSLDSRLPRDYKV